MRRLACLLTMLACCVGCSFNLSLGAGGDGFRLGLGGGRAAGPTRPYSVTADAPMEEPPPLAPGLLPPADTAPVVMTARASSAWHEHADDRPGHTPDKALDGDPDTAWNAAALAPAWIELDLGREALVSGLELRFDQAPAGNTVHEVWVSREPIGNDRSKARLAHRAEGYTEPFRTDRWDFEEPWQARYVQVYTVSSPSWVAWFEIKVHREAARVARSEWPSLEPEGSFALVECRRPHPRHGRHPCSARSRITASNSTATPGPWTCCSIWSAGTRSTCTTSPSPDSPSNTSRT